MKYGRRHTSRRTPFLVGLLALGLGLSIALAVFALLMASSLRQEMLLEQQIRAQAAPRLAPAPLRSIYGVGVWFPPQMFVPARSYFAPSVTSFS